MASFSIFNIFKKIRNKKNSDSSYLKKFTDNGVIIKDLNSTYIHPNVEISSGTVIFPSTYILESSKIGKNCIIGPNSTLADAIIGSNVEIVYSIILNSRINDNTQVGPFAYIRDNSTIGSNSVIGNNVEIKASNIGDNSVSKHFSYIGDAIIDNNVNIGAGFVVANYDGRKKHKSQIQDNVFIGSNSTIISPVLIEKNSTIGAGSVVINNVFENSTVVGIPAKEIKKGKQ